MDLHCVWIGIYHVWWYIFLVVLGGLLSSVLGGAIHIMQDRDDIYVHSVQLVTFYLYYHIQKCENTRNKNINQNYHMYWN